MICLSGEKIFMRISKIIVDALEAEAVRIWDSRKDPIGLAINIFMIINLVLLFAIASEVLDKNGYVQHQCFKPYQDKMNYCYEKEREDNRLNPGKLNVTFNYSSFNLS